MADLTSRLSIKLIDGVTAPARVAARSLASLTAASRAAITGLNGWMNAAGDPRKIGRNLRRLGDDARRVGDTVSGPLALLGALGAKAAFEFEKAGNLLEALGDATPEQRRQFEALANTLNAKYPQSLSEILKTGTELLKAGLNFQQMLGAIEPTLATAILGDMKPSEVATIISAAINAFQMPKENAEQALASVTKIADRMSYAAIKTTADLKDMGEMFKYVAGAAAATGNSIDEVTAIAMAFANNKVVGAEAGVALRSAIIRLAKGSTKEGRAAMARAGLDFKDYNKGPQKITSDRILGGLMAGGIDASPIKAQIEALLNDPTLATAPMKLAAKMTVLIQEFMGRTGSAMDAAEIAQNVQDSIISAGNKIDLLKFFEDLKQKVAAGTLTMGDISQILEGRHFARYQALLQADLNALVADIQKNSGGYVMDRYKVTIQGIVGPVYDLTAALEKLSVALGRSAFPEAAKAMNSLADSIQKMAETDPTTLNWIVKAGLVLAALAPVAVIFSAAAGLWNIFRIVLLSIAGGIAALVGAPVWLVVAGLAALAAAAGLIWYNWDKMKEWAANVGQWISDGVQAVKDGAAALYQGGVDLMNSLWEGMKSKFQAILDWFKSLGDQLGKMLPNFTAPNYDQNGLPAPPPGKAAGGPVMGGRAYVVGERGPELFVPGSSGRIVPNGARMGGGVHVTQNLSLTIHGAGDGDGIADQIKRVMRDEVHRLFRGVQGDTGLVFT